MLEVSRATPQAARLCADLKPGMSLLFQSTGNKFFLAVLPYVMTVNSHAWRGYAPRTMRIRTASGWHDTGSNDWKTEVIVERVDPQQLYFAILNSAAEQPTPCLIEKYRFADFNDLDIGELRGAGPTFEQD